MKIGFGGIFLHPERSRSSMDRMTDSGSVGWAFESPRDHDSKSNSTDYQCYFALWGTYWGARIRNMNPYNITTNQPRYTDWNTTQSTAAPPSLGTPQPPRQPPITPPIIAPGTAPTPPTASNHVKGLPPPPPEATAQPTPQNQVFRQIQTSCKPVF